MTDPSKPIPVSEATEYPVGLTFDVKFEAFEARLVTLPNNEIRFQVPTGPYAGTETVRIKVTPLRPGLFIVSWVEAKGATVVHVEDFAEGLLYSHATLSDGTFFSMKGPITLISAESVQ